MVLGRCRRFAGRPQVAGRIMALVAREAHAGWRAWLAWELALAGGAGLPVAPPQARPEGSRAARAAAALVAALVAARGGDRLAFDAEAAVVGAGIDAAAPFRDEALDLLAALDARRPATARLGDWIRGRVAAPPAGLQGVSAPAAVSPGEETPHGFPPEVFACVVATPAGPGRRILRAGVALLDGEPTVGSGPPSRPPRLPIEEARQTRSAAALAVLALAGPEGLGRAELFRQVYGFSFNPRLHAGLFDVLAHRARTAAASVGALERRGEWIGLRVSGPCVLPDPRCAIDTQDQLLACLARTPSASTEALARTLGLPVRTARAALRQLVADGACAERREGRNVYYSVQDTTFEAPIARSR